MKKRLLMAAAIVSLATVTSSAQDIHFSQFYENAIYRNPGLTGIFSGDYKGGVNYRTQWGNIANPFQTVMASFESRVLVNEDAGDYLSYGLTASYDHAGSISFNSLQVYPAVNYNKSMEDNHGSYLSAGFTAGYVQRSVDAGKMTFDNQYSNGAYNPGSGSGETMGFGKINHFDLGAGVSFNSTAGAKQNVNYYIGGAVFHVTKPRESFNPNENFIRLNTKYCGNLGIRVNVKNQYSLTFHANYLNQQPYQEIIFGGLAGWKPAVGEGEVAPYGLYVGCFYRVSDAVIPTVKIEWNAYSFTASYDVTTSSLKPNVSSEGGWEFSIYARGRSKKKIDVTKCPRFEDAVEGATF